MFILCFANKAYVMSRTLALLVLCASSIFALAAAFVAQYGFDLQPCVLCVYQRIPFAMVAILSGGYLIFTYLHAPKTTPPATQKSTSKTSIVILAVAALVMFANSGIAFFHTGVERGWWKGLEQCTAGAPLDFNNLMASMRTAGPVRCDAIPFELFGLSMANYNVFFCAALGLFALYAACPLQSRRHAK
jgi:disulfide bond formation protein DsbB